MRAFTLPQSHMHNISNAQPSNGVANFRYKRKSNRNKKIHVRWRIGQNNFHRTIFCQTNLIVKFSRQSSAMQWIVYQIVIDLICFIEMGTVFPRTFFLLRFYFRNCASAFWIAFQRLSLTKLDSWLGLHSLCVCHKCQCTVCAVLLHLYIYMCIFVRVTQ